MTPPGLEEGDDPLLLGIVQGIVEGTVKWTGDPDFGYDVAAAIPGVHDLEILQPRRLYARQGRTSSDESLVKSLG